MKSPKWHEFGPLFQFGRFFKFPDFQISDFFGPDLTISIPHIFLMGFGYCQNGSSQRGGSQKYAAPGPIFIHAVLCFRFVDLADGFVRLNPPRLLCCFPVICKVQPEMIVSVCSHFGLAFCCFHFCLCSACSPLLLYWKAGSWQAQSVTIGVSVGEVQKIRGLHCSLIRYR